MVDKWSKLSIYDVDHTIEDEDGEKHVFTFKPLPWAYFPKAYDVISKLEAAGFMEDTEFDDEKEATKDFFSKINEGIVSELSDILKAMVSNSYPDKSEGQIESFVMANMFSLIIPLFQVISRQSKDKRRADQALKND